MNFSNTPYSRVSKQHTGKLARGVSIIGVGITPFGSTLETPALRDLSDKELTAWAAQEAMTDAGVTGRDIDAFCFAQSTSQLYYTQTAANIFNIDWLGMRGKPSNQHEEAGCSSYCAFNEAVMTIASGKHDMVIVCGADTELDYADSEVPAYRRFPMDTFEPAPSAGGDDYATMRLTDNAYSRWNGTYMAALDESVSIYMQKYGLSRESVDDVLDALAITMRHNAARNPLALHQKDLETEARENGFEKVRDYLRSEKNPFWSAFHRKAHSRGRCDGGGAVILCTSELAKRYHKKPVAILGMAIGSMDSRYPRFLTRSKEEAFRQAFEAANIRGEDIDLLFASDVTAGNILLDSEMAGYIPEGEAWKYALNGELGYGGSKPVNTHGGSIGFGYSSGILLFEQLVEGVRQMRGECGDRQVKKIPETVFISGFGEPQEGAAIILKMQK